MSFLRRLVPVVCLLAAIGFVPAAHAVVFGAQVDGDFTYYTRGAWTWDQVQSSLSRLRAAGATVARSGADWARTEPRPPRAGRRRYDWGYDDSVVGALAAAGLRWEPMLDYTPRWAQKHLRPARSGNVVSPLPPASNRVYAAYAAAFARRYGVGGSFWREHPTIRARPVSTFEIWNEPDCRWTWGPDVNLQDYARLYGAAYRAIKDVDRRSAVITGGLAFTRSSLPRLLRAFQGLPIDGLAVHPYAPDAVATIAMVRWTQQQLVADHRGRTPLTVNEYGWNSVPKTWQAVPRRALAQNVSSSIVGLARIRHMRAVIPFEWSDSNWGLSGGGLANGIKRVRGLG